MQTLFSFSSKLNSSFVFVCLYALDLQTRAIYTESSGATVQWLYLVCTRACLHV